MIRACPQIEERGVLRLGDEPRDLALGRCIRDVRPSARLVVPGKGEVPPPTAFEGEDAEWLVSRMTESAPDSGWLRDLAAVDAGRTPDPLRGAAPLTALREISVLLASARRSAAHDIAYAFEALRRGPDEVRRDPRLRAFREEIRRATGPALRARPVFAWRVALVICGSAEGVEDIVAARWRDKLPRYVVLAANPVYENGLVSYAFRSRTCSLISAGDSVEGSSGRAPARGRDGASILLSALPAGLPPPRTERGGTAGRGSLPPDAFEELLARLRFRKEVRTLV